MTDDLDQMLLLLVGIFASLIVLLVVLAGMEARLGDPPGQYSWSPRRWFRLRGTPRPGRACGPAGRKVTADR